MGEDSDSDFIEYDSDGVPILKINFFKEICITDKEFIEFIGL